MNVEIIAEKIANENSKILAGSIPTNQKKFEEFAYSATAIQVALNTVFDNKDLYKNYRKEIEDLYDLIPNEKRGKTHYFSKENLEKMRNEQNKVQRKYAKIYWKNHVICKADEANERFNIYLNLLFKKFHENHCRFPETIRCAINARTFNRTRIRPNTYKFIVKNIDAKIDASEFNKEIETEINNYVKYYKMWS